MINNDSSFAYLAFLVALACTLTYVVCIDRGGENLKLGQ